jgi:hypothetical protein
MSDGAPDTGGVDIGYMSQVGGSIPGFQTAVRLAGRGPEWQELGRPYQARLPAKDYNDQPASFTVGSDQGRPVMDAGSWAP